MNADYTNPDFWDNQRLIADPEADAAVSGAVHESGIHVREILGHLMQNNSIPRHKLPHALVDYLSASASLPDWHDPEKIRVAQNIFEEFGVEISFALLCKSLPECYCCARGAQVLSATGRLCLHGTAYKPYTKRVMESLQFAMNVLDKDGFTPGGKAIETVQKVRLIHSSIRHYMREDMPTWNVTSLGVPINQEDLAITLTTFSTSVIKGLDMMGVKISDEQKESYIHLWAVAGHILGIHPDIIPHTVAESETVQEIIMSRQARYSESGVELTKSLIEFMEYITPGTIADNTIVHLLDHLVDPRWASAIGVTGENAFHRNLVERIIDFGMKELEKLQNRGWLVTKIMNHFSCKIIQAVIDHCNDHKEEDFDIPTSLTDRLKAA